VASGEANGKALAARRLVLAEIPDTVVVGKLFLLDLANSGTVARIVSFLGVGVLLMIIGYVAPVPPGDAEKQQG